MNQTADHTMSLPRTFELQREKSRSGLPASWPLRADRLQRLRALVSENRAAIASAISDDFGSRSRHETELLEINHVLDGIAHSLRHGRHWMRARRVRAGYKFWPGRAYRLPQALGVVGIVVPWNYPLDLSLGPVNSALAAGNRVMVKLSELTPRFGLLLAELAARYFAPDELAIVNGDADTARQFCALPFDHLLFTGSTAVGHHVMRAASDNLTPVTLELGGKSPVILGPGLSGGADFARAVERIVIGKTFNAGQTCIAPDYVLLPRAQLAQFIACAEQAVQRFYPALASTDDYTSIISDHHFARLQAIVDDALARGGKAWPLSAAGSDASRRRFAPLALSDLASDSRALQEELFGPILPLVVYEQLSEAIAYINARPRPLALYVFDSDPKNIAPVLAQTVSGGVTVNGTLLHVGPDALPFGGVGASGMGCHHGEAGFDTFSHFKSVYRQASLSLLSWLYPPYGRRTELFLKMPKPP